MEEEKKYWQELMPKQHALGIYLTASCACKECVDRNGKPKKETLEHFLLECENAKEVHYQIEMEIREVLEESVDPKKEEANKRNLQDKSEYRFRTPVWYCEEGSQMPEGKVSRAPRVSCITGNKKRIDMEEVQKQVEKFPKKWGAAGIFPTKITEWLSSFHLKEGVTLEKLGAKIWKKVVYTHLVMWRERCAKVYKDRQL
jgi:hypothetical protein